MSGGLPSPRFDPPDAGDFAALETAVHRDWVRGRLAAALAHLPPVSRQAVLLRYAEGWEVEVVADHLGLTPRETRALCRRALGALRADLGQGS